MNISYPWFISLVTDLLSRALLQISQSYVTLFKGFCPRNSPIQSSSNSWFHKVCEKLTSAEIRCLCVFQLFHKPFSCFCSILTFFYIWIIDLQWLSRKAMYNAGKKLSFLKDLQKFALELPHTSAVLHGQRPEATHIFSILSLSPSVSISIPSVVIFILQSFS